MPSPFPGMDPFIESRVWKDFHHRLIDNLSDALVPRVRPRHVVRVEERVTSNICRRSPSDAPIACAGTPARGLPHSLQAWDDGLISSPSASKDSDTTAGKGPGATLDMQTIFNTLLRP